MGKFPGQKSNLSHSGENLESLTTRPSGSSPVWEYFFNWNFIEIIVDSRAVFRNKTELLSSFTQFNMHLRVCPCALVCLFSAAHSDHICGFVFLPPQSRHWTFLSTCCPFITTPTPPSPTFSENHYSWPLNSMNWKYTYPLIHGFFLIVNTALLHDRWLVESMNGELQVQRNLVCGATVDTGNLEQGAYYKLHGGFFSCG